MCRRIVRQPEGHFLEARRVGATRVKHGRPLAVRLVAQYQDGGAESLGEGEHVGGGLVRQRERRLPGVTPARETPSQRTTL